jgi:DNA-binding transcriptional ArsR family regulator
MMVADPLSITLSAIADPTRRAILARLSRGEASVTELAAPFDVTMPAITKHLKVLERAGLILRGRDAQWRPCRLRAGPLREAADWIGRYRRFWEESFDRLDEYLKEVQAGEGKAAKQPAAADALRSKAASSEWREAESRVRSAVGRASTGGQAGRGTRKATRKARKS